MQYKVKVKNRTVKVWDSDGNYGWAKCHPLDKFDVGVGFKIAVSKIKPGFGNGDRFQLAWWGDRKKFCDTKDSAMVYVESIPSHDAFHFCYGVAPWEVNTVDEEYFIRYSLTNYISGDKLYIIEDNQGRLFCFKNLVKEEHGDAVYGV